MKTKLTLIILISIIIAASYVFSAQLKEKENSIAKVKVTFIELGSVNCIPCKMMQPIMKNIEKKYGDQVKVIFYDVWTQQQKYYAQLYKIRVIPTQVFLDENGKEFHRHEGFYPEAEIDKLLQGKGLKPKKS
jgi:thioredoxin 1